MAISQPRQIATVSYYPCVLTQGNVQPSARAEFLLMAVSEHVRFQSLFVSISSSLPFPCGFVNNSFIQTLVNTEVSTFDHVDTSRLKFTARSLLHLDWSLFVRMALAN